MTITGLIARRRAEPAPAPLLPGALDAAPPPYGPDRLVFGPQDAEPGERGPFPSAWCACGAGLTGGAACWGCNNEGTM